MTAIKTNETMNDHVYNFLPLNFLRLKLSQIYSYIIRLSFDLGLLNGFVLFSENYSFSVPLHFKYVTYYAENQERI